MIGLIEGMNLTTPNEIRAVVASLREHLEWEIDMVANQIKDQASADGDMGWIQHCAKEAELLKRDLQALSAIEEHAVDVLCNTLSFESDSVEVSPSGMRTLIIEVSQGMINQHLLTLTDAKRQGKVKAGEKFEITLPNGTTFTTDLCDPGNKLRERGYIREFYEGSKISEGDKVILKEVSFGCWRLLAKDSEEGRALLAPKYHGGETNAVERPANTKI